MSAPAILFPHQLFYRDNPLEAVETVYLVEEWLFFREFDFHKQKLAYHRAAMLCFAEFLTNQKKTVHYISSAEPGSDVRNLIAKLSEKHPKIQIIDPTDNWLARRIHETAKKAGIELIEHESPLFLNTRADLHSFFNDDKKSFLQADFYKKQREKRDILLTTAGEPRGGKWSFDQENRKKYPRDQKPPQIPAPAPNAAWQEAVAYIDKHFCDNPGRWNSSGRYPVNRSEAESWLEVFFQTRFSAFGSYEDAIVQDEGVLHHSVLSPMLNTGLLSPDEVIDGALAFAKKKAIPLNSLEGFIRQILGWREFIRGMYETRGTAMRNENFWGLSRKMPSAFYDGSTGILPVDHTIKKVLETGYCHHIERLMILGNFMLLCEIHPREVYRWFMELFIDAYDWVMVPNVYGMSQFTDGGSFATKPYISGSNYILKMSDYPRGDWQQTWDGLFWRFMHVNRGFFSGNPRMAMLLGTLDKMSDEKRKAHLSNAEKFLKTLDAK